MSGATTYALAGIALIAIGLHAFVVRPEVLRKLLAFNVLGGGIFIVLLALAPGTVAARADPIAQALVLTGIVVAVAATALGLTLLRRLHATTGQTCLSEDAGDA